MRLWVVCIAVLCMNNLCSSTDAGKCVPKNVHTCRGCLETGGFCAWCKKLNFTRDSELESVRCASVEDLKTRGCEDKDIINPKGSISVVENIPLTSAGNKFEKVVQLSPQKVNVNLRPGIPVKFNVTFKRAEGYPIDLYYLMDLSYSMNDDLVNVKKLGRQLLHSLELITKAAKIGFGAFVDKTVLPYVSTSPEHLDHPCTEKNVKCSRPFAYKHVLSLTDKLEVFEKHVGEQIISGNLDTPEGGFDAMLQAAVCGDKIGWRNNTRLLVFTSDAGFHFAGDGKLAGIVTPNDGNCHLDDGIYKDSIHYDYPSIGQLAQKLSENNIQPIFAVTKSVVNIYQELSQLIPKSAVGELSADSSNVIQLITAAYNNLSSKIILEPSRVPEGVSVTFVSHCNNDKMEKEKGECSEVKIGTEISFTVTVDAKECPKDMTNAEFEIRSLGFQEKLVVQLTFDCQCECKDLMKDAPYCSDGNGDLECGVCSCHQDRIGRLCDCRAKGGNTDALDAQCRPDNSSQLCSGQGDCVCGKCVCYPRDDPREKVEGKYCHCNNFNCQNYDNKLCGGNGDCVCGKCQCHKDFSGERCECPLAKDKCMRNGLVCNGHGECKCNKCHCTNSSYSGSVCEICLTCNECERYKDCAYCWGFKQGNKKELCGTSCPHHHNMVNKIDTHEKQCKVDIGGGCNMYYRYIDDANGKISFIIKNELDCQKPPNVAAIIGGSVGGVLLIGIVLLLLWKSYITWLDKKELARFEKERHNAKWNDGVNPIYKSATTTVVNPRFENN